MCKHCDVPDEKTREADAHLPYDLSRRSLALSMKTLVYAKRERLAAAALTSCNAAWHIDPDGVSSHGYKLVYWRHTPEEIAFRCYKLADAMVREGNR